MPSTPVFRVFSLKDLATAFHMLEQRRFTTRMRMREGQYYLHIRQEALSSSSASGHRLLTARRRSLNFSSCGPIWFAEEDDLTSRLAVAAGEPCMPRSDEADGNKPAAVRARKWTRRIFPRSFHRNCGVKRSAVPAGPPSSMIRGPVTEDGVAAQKKRHVAKAPASHESNEQRTRDVTVTRPVAQESSVVACLRAGRTLERLWPLMDRNLFQKPPMLGGPQPLSPAAGLFATDRAGQQVSSPVCIGAMGFPWLM